MEASLSAHDRSAGILEISRGEFDLVVIGGGITGAGVARDAASRGMRVALVEARDFAEGTSSRSSKLIHGGIRYLENFEFGLVFEALSERRLLFELAPHLVHPLRFVLPLYQGGRVGMFKMGLGMWLYDALSMFEAPEAHERLSPAESLERLPLLRGQGLMGSFVYSDAYMDDDRLTIETLRSAASHGAVCVNHVSAVGALMEEGRVRGIVCKDALTGERFEVRGRHFVSSVGPWTDELATSLLQTWKKLLRPSKGVHLTFKRDRLPITQAVVMAANKEKRIVFGIPRHEMVIIGTTDTDFPEAPESVTATPDDVRYLLGVAHEYFPGAKLTAEDILATYAGVRPLVDDGAETESKTSREHIILRDPRNVTFVAGGKYTTYRLMAEQTVKAALESFPLEDQIRFRLNETKSPLNPLATCEKLDAIGRSVKALSRESGWSEDAVRFLIGRHGEEALELMRYAPSMDSFGEAPKGQPSGEREDRAIWTAELVHAVRRTMCLNLIDFYTRRSPLFLARADHGLRLIGSLSAAMAHELGWSDDERRAQVETVHQYIQRELSWKRAFGIKDADF